MTEFGGSREVEIPRDVKPLHPGDRLWREGKDTRLCSCGQWNNINEYLVHLKSGDHNRRMSGRLKS